MSKIKRSLPEDFSVLDGTELDGTPDINDVPDDLMLVMCIGSDINELRDRLTDSRLADQLRSYATSLYEMAEKVEKPF